MINKLKVFVLFVALFIGGMLTAKDHGISAAVTLSLVTASLALGYDRSLVHGNTVTNLIPDAYAALDVVSRELTGFINSVGRDSRADQAAQNQNVRIPITPANGSIADITPAMSLPAESDQAITNAVITISKLRYTKFSWSAEERMGLQKGPGILTVQQDQIAQAVRALINEAEAFIGTTIAQGSSRAYGTAGTAPFASTIADLAQIGKILDDNGAPSSDRHCVMSTAAALDLRSLSNLFKVNEAGNDSLLRQGTLGDLFGFGLRQSAGTNNQAAGTGSSYVLNGAHAVGATNVVVKTGSGTLVAGDVLTINGFKYVVQTGVAAAGTAIINAPGLRSAGADGDTVTVNAASVRNAGFTRNSTLFATRLPAIDSEGDIATDRAVVTDPRTGIAFEFAVYPGFRMNTYFVGWAYGATVIKPEHSAILLG